jgi:MFS family permease
VSDTQGQEEVRVRRVPKYGAFMAVGGGIGAIATLILTSLYEPDPRVGFGALFGYFALYGIPAGVLLGALLALLLDWIGRKRARAVTAEHDTRDQPGSPS